jgi:hypothetical protein
MERGCRNRYTSGDLERAAIILPAASIEQYKSDQHRYEDGPANASSV